MKLKILVAAISFLFAQFLQAKEFTSDQEVQTIVDQVFARLKQSRINPTMLRYVFYDSNLCKSCKPEYVEEQKNKLQDQMGSDFSRYKEKYYEGHFEEAKYGVSICGDKFPQDLPFCRSSKHIIEKNIIFGCDDFAKAFIELALVAGYSPDSMKFVFLMSENGFKSACKGRAGKVMDRWAEGGHHIVGIKASGTWKTLNTTDPKVSYASLTDWPKRYDKIVFPNNEAVPFSLLFAGAFDIQKYIQPFTVLDVLNIYVSGTPDSSICESEPK